MVDVIARGLAARGGGGSGDSYTKAEIDAMLLNKQNVLVSGENIKTVNGNSLLGAGNVTIATNQNFPASWASYTTGTTSAFCAMVAADTEAVPGMTYLGELSCSDFASAGISIGNGEAVVEITEGAVSEKVIHITLTSGNVSPYKWEYTWWNGGSPVGWHAYQPLITETNKLSSDYVDFNVTADDIARLYHLASSELQTEVEVDGDIIKILTEITIVNGDEVEIYAGSSVSGDDIILDVDALNSEDEAIVDARSDSNGNGIKFETPSVFEYNGKIYL